MPKKSLVIGLGGTGDWVLTFLKSRLHAAYGSEAVEKDVQFLLVDTIEPRVRQDALAPGGSDKIVVGMAGEQHEERVARLGKVHLEMHEYLGTVGEAHSTAQKILADDAYTRHLDWFPAGFYLGTLPAAALNISMGAGQWRQIGRLAMVMHSTEFVNRVGRLITQCGIQQNETLMVYLVCSVGGGTGAGMFLDAAALIRKLVESRGYKTWVIGFLLLPGAFAEVWGGAGSERAVPRSFAAYRELNRFQTQAGRNVPFPISYSSTNETQAIDVTTKLYDTVFLVDAVGPLKQAKPWDGVSPSIADALEVFIDRTRGWRILENLINASARIADQVQMNKTQAAQFHSIGSHKIVLPARQYGHIFTSQFVSDFLHRIFPTTYAADKKPTGLVESPVSQQEYERAAREFMKNAGHVFMEAVEFLTGGTRSAKNFGEATLRDYGALLRPKADAASQNLSFAILEADALDRDDEENAIEVTSSEEPEEAARRIVRECERKLTGYFARLNDVMEKASEAVEAELTAALEERVEQLLNGRVEGFTEQCVHAAISFTTTVSTQCDALAVDVLAKGRDKITRQNGSAQWALSVAQARTAMEGKFDGWFKKNAATKAQKAYIEAQGDWADARKLEVVFDGLAAYVTKLKQSADRVHGQLTHWTRLATREFTVSAASVAIAEAAKIRSEIQEAGKSYTSSYGLSAYTGDESRVDTTMGGYQDVLYKRLTKDLLTTWSGAFQWKYANHEPSIVLNGIAADNKLTAIESGADLYRRLFELAVDGIAPHAEKLSIFDYFLHQNISPETVATFFDKNTRPLLDGLQGATPTSELYLLVKRPQTAEGADFLNRLRAAFGKTVFTTNGEILQGAATDDFDNPYTLTLLYLLQDVRDGQIALLNEHARRYQQALVKNDAHVVNHIFRCEQEAGRIEKSLGAMGGMVGSEHGFFRLHPRVTRCLDQPARVRQFARLLALGAVKFQEMGDVFVWAIVPPGQEATSRRAIWLTRKSVGAEDPRTSQSLLLAMEQFCLAKRSANPQARQEIDYEPGLDQILQARQNELRAQGGFSAVIAAYEKFLKDNLPKHLDDYVSASEGHTDPLHSDEERESLRTVIQYYLDQETAKLRPLARVAAT
jgi:hypothetical protein